MVYSIKSFARVKKTCVHWSGESSVILDENAFTVKMHMSSWVFGLKSKL